VTATSFTQATTPNVPTPPKRQPLLGQVYGCPLSPLARTGSFTAPGSGVARNCAAVSIVKPHTRRAAGWRDAFSGEPESASPSSGQITALEPCRSSPVCHLSKTHSREITVRAIVPGC
jgi:hypothetical protein